VTAFDAFKTPCQAANFIEEWFTSKKGKSADFGVDFQAVVDRARLVRRHAVNSDYPLDLLLLSNPKRTETDFLFYFILDLIDACSSRRIPLIISRLAWKQVKKVIHSKEFRLENHH
jgi:hypothetical protein